jgi:lipopolysaccharide transport system ATP-binding protein
MSSFAIQVRGLSKQYTLGELKLRDSVGEALRGWYQRAARRRDGGVPERQGPRQIWALEDVSFELAPGEILGIIGCNGAGKSTLLKILSRITEPTRGRAEIRGRVGSLLEVGTGFHADLTGRENVFMNGAILGMTRHEVRAKFDQIVDFAGIGEFIDTPVKRYSSGMYTRLAFAVAAHLEPDILIVDEVLAVGDVGFQKKCIARMGDLTRSGRTVIFVSHNMGAVAELCRRAILLEKGRLLFAGPVAQTIDRYTRLVGLQGATVELSEDPNLPCSIVGLRLTDGNGNETQTFDLKDEMAITIDYVVRERLDDLQLTVTASRNQVEVFSSFDTDNVDSIPETVPGTYRAQLRLPPLFLKAGSYSARIATGTSDRLLQDFQYALRFEIEELSIDTRHRGFRSERQGQVICPGRWNVTRISADAAA